jgi:uncharacterized protein YbjT (DUF2867 family)
MLPGPQDLFCTDLPTRPQPSIGRILVAGATGYVGGRLVPDLLSRGCSLRVMVRNRVFDTNKWPNHLRNRLAVLQILKQGAVPVIVLRTAIIIGSGSASYEIIKNLVLNLPVILLPSWARNKCQPIPIRLVSYTGTCSYPSIILFLKTYLKILILAVS